MDRYFLILKKRLVKGTGMEEKGFSLAREAYEYQDGQWVEIDSNEINDRIMGYDPSEVPMYRMGNDDIMEELDWITEEEMKEFIKKNS